MEWIKRNLVLVIGGVVSLVLVGGAAFYLFSKWQANAETSTRFEEKKQQLKALQEQNPYPNKENIEATKLEEQRAADLLAKFNQYFAPVPFSTNVDNAGEFKNLLENTIQELQQRAQSNAVTLPTNFNFAFTIQRTLYRVDTTNLPGLTEQVAHVKELCKILFDSRVSELIRVRRAPLSTNDTGALGNYPQDYLASRQVVTNNPYAMVFPYELVFKAASTELGTVLDRMASATNGFMVKLVKVEPSDTTSADEVTGVAGDSTAGMSVQAMMAARYGSRYGRMMRPGTGAAPAATATTPAPAAKSPVTFLKEKSLRTVMYVDVVRLKDK